MTAGAHPEVVYVGDDFTGASDTLATLSRAGRRARLYLDLPEPEIVAADGLDAVGVATALRSMSAKAIAAAIEAMAPPLKQLGATFVHYKVCSTFDSSPDTGSIGTAVAALSRYLDPALTVVIGGQPSLGRYCHFGHLFAAASDGEVHRIDRHPVMRRHPVTPMMESDLRLHLKAQGLGPFRLLDLPSQAAGALGETILSMHSEGERLLLFDAGSISDLERIGRTLRGLRLPGPILLVGASSVAEALTLSDQKPHGAVGAKALLRHGDGPAFVLAGSRSSLTKAQVDAARSFHRVPLPPEALITPGAMDGSVEHCRAALERGENVLAHLLPEADYGMTSFGLAQRSAEFVAAVAHWARFGRLGVAGGDTSSAVIAALGFSSLSYGFDLDRGVPICVGQAGEASLDGIMLMLKGGQMGASDLFDRFAQGNASLAA